MPLALANPSSDELTATAAGALLGVSRFRVGAFIARGLLKARSLGRTYIVDRRDLLAFRDAHPELVAPTKKCGEAARRSA